MRDITTLFHGGGCKKQYSLGMAWNSEVLGLMSESVEDCFAADSTKEDFKSQGGLAIRQFDFFFHQDARCLLFL